MQVKCTNRKKGKCLILTFELKKWVINFDLVTPLIDKSIIILALLWLFKRISIKSLSFGSYKICWCIWRARDCTIGKVWQVGNHFHHLDELVWKITPDVRCPTCDGDQGIIVFCFWLLSVILNILHEIQRFDMYFKTESTYEKIFQLQFENLELLKTVIYGLCFSPR